MQYMYSNTVFLVCIHFYGVCYIVFLTDGSFLCYSTVVINSPQTNFIGILGVGRPRS